MCKAVHILKTVKGMAEQSQSAQEQAKDLQLHPPCPECGVALRKPQGHEASPVFWCEGCLEYRTP